jgi:crotonobetainyl-CoA:carnitine CoA-transferase CaiB-like acyl-CoA transferase
VQTDHPQAGPTRAIGCPVHLSATPVRVDRPAPLFGEHTREVLRECDFSEAEIDELLREGIIAEVQRTAAAS